MIQARYPVTDLLVFSNSHHIGRTESDGVGEAPPCWKRANGFSLVGSQSSWRMKGLGKTLLHLQISHEGFSAFGHFGHLSEGFGMIRVLGMAFSAWNLSRLLRLSRSGLEERCD